MPISVDRRALAQRRHTPDLDLIRADWLDEPAEEPVGAGGQAGFEARDLPTLRYRTW